MLLHFLPPSMANVVDNLWTKESLTYNNVRSRLLDFSSSAGIIGDAFLVKKSNKNQGKKKNKNRSSDTRNSGNSNNNNNNKRKPGILPADKCSYCCKRNLPSKGHTHTNCAILKKAQNQNNNSASVLAKSANPEKAPKAHGLGASKHASNYIDSGSSFYAFQADDDNYVQTSHYGTTLKATESTSKTSEVWIFDTEALHHITANFSLLQEPTPAIVGSIKVGGGQVLYSTHKGNVRLTVENDGNSVDFLLSNVLFIPH